MPQSVFKQVFVFAFILFLFPVFGYAQSKGAMPVDVNVHFLDKSDNRNFILYNVKESLAIKDFQGRSDMSSEGVGATFSGIQLTMEGQSKNARMNLNVDLMVYFDKSQSWMKPEGKDERVLKHEQIHFDLTAIYACKMYDAILKESYDSKNVKQKLHDIHERITAELQSQQSLYDKETKHGTIFEEQQKWAEKVSKMKLEITCL